MLFPSTIVVGLLSFACIALAQQPATTLTTTENDNSNSTAEPVQTTTLTPEVKEAVAPPKVNFLHYDTDIKHRYASTHVTSKISNPADIAQEVHFHVTLPENAFISKFVMTIKNVDYEAYVKEKEEAKADYDAAVQAGQTAAHISLIDRDSNKFGVSVNVEAGGKINFNLTYEELLSRSLGFYSLILNVNPGQIVKDLAVKVKIQETSDITSLKVPAFKSTNEVSEADKEEENKLAKINKNPKNSKEAEVTWSPSYEEQKEMAKDGLKGRLIIQYDVDRKEHPNQILVDEGYFVHFFAPSELPPLRQHVVFVLDISGSMFGEKIQQLRDAMLKILTDLNPQDHFSIVLFSDVAYIWSPKKTPVLEKLFKAGYYENDNETTAALNDHEGEILAASPSNVEIAKQFIQNIGATSATNIIDGLRQGLKLVADGRTKLRVKDSPAPQPILIFLTDGEPNVELTNPQEIIDETKKLNQELKAPIYSLAFGQGADIQFLKRLSKANHGFARNIYEGSDATLQLNKFYKEISSPLLANVSFVYLSGDVDNSSLTDRDFPLYFDGSELVVAGKLNGNQSERDVKLATLDASYSSQTTLSGGENEKHIAIDYCYTELCLPSPIPHPQPVIIQPPRTPGHLEKMWAYMTIKQLLEKDSTNPENLNSEKNSTEKQKALELALQYKFVTPLTSLVVVKPNETAQAVQPEKSDKKPGMSGVPLSINQAYGSPMGAVAAFGAPVANYGLNFLARPMLSTPHVANFAPTTDPDRVGVFEESVDVNGNNGTEHLIDMGGIIPDALNNSTSDSTIVPISSVQWLGVPVGILPSEDPVIELDSGNYTVGLNKSIGIFDNCTSPEGPGACKHLEHCSLSSFLNNVTEYMPYFCVISAPDSISSQQYAGVCCPERFNILPPSLP